MLEIAGTHQPTALPRWVQPLTSAITTGIMSGAVSGVATARTLGMDSVLAAPTLFMVDWGRAFVFSWPLAFVLFTVFMPPVKRGVEGLGRAWSARAN